MPPTPFPNSPAGSDLGVFVDSDDEGLIEMEAEPRVRYTEGLYCPLYIGQVLDGRYCIEHKLGWGGFSIVWLAHDIQQSKAVALKVTVPGQRGEYKCYMQKEIARTVRDTSNLVTCRAVFCLPSRGSDRHVVFVFPVQGPSLDTVCSRLPPAFRVPAVKYLLLGLKSLHDAGIVHRDLNCGAVMWNIDPIDHWTTREIYQRLRRPQKVALPEALVVGEGKPGEIVESIRFPVEMLRRSVALGDFGHAIKSGTLLANTIQSPAMWCAPERLHGMNPSFASDMWSFTCIFAMLYLRVEAIWGDGPTLLSRIVGTVGPFPEHWKGRYGERTQDWWYDQSGKMPRSLILGAYETLEHKVDRLRPDISPDERRHVLSVLSKGFCRAPEHRITAAQLLEDPSFNALMSYYIS